MSTSIQAGHALPTPPGSGQQQYHHRPDTRPRSKSGFSLHSNKSHKSGGSQGKNDLYESHEEKQSKRLKSKADPLLAMSEAEPSAIANEHSTQLAPIRALQHRDANGNPIAEPDRSNPTRSRWERPLDTIRAFEAAIDGNYSRQTMSRTDSSGSVSGMNRRSSYVGSNAGGMSPRNPQDNYYGGRPNSSARPDSYYDNGAGNGYNPSRARYPRGGSENNGYGNQHSYETGTNGSGSSGDPMGYSTDPSSDNSSIDRMQGGPPIPEHGDTYGFNGFDNGNSPHLRSYNQNGQADQQGYAGGYQGQGGPNTYQRTQAQPTNRAPIKLGTGSGDAGPTFYEPPKPEKRKSWLGKKFGKA